MNKGIFTISLDFELFWGVRDHRTINNYGDNIDRVLDIVPRLLQLFSKYNVHCTWATVGFLFFDNKDHLIKSLPSHLPQYDKKEYDPFAYINNAISLEEKYHFAPHLIEMINNTPGQEVATHTFSHFYTLEKNTTAEQFKSDLENAVLIANRKGVKIESIVFPRNQYGESHIAICRSLGIKVYRGNEESAVYKPLSREDENKFRRATRLADAYINLTGHHCHKIPKPAEIINIPSSRFLRPYNSKLKFIDGLRFSRIKKSMEYAAKNGLIYHLWWHPHNFGNNTEENFSFLERILKEFEKLHNKYEMHSLTMSEIYHESRN